MYENTEYAGYDAGCAEGGYLKRTNNNLKYRPYFDDLCVGNKAGDP